MRSAHKSGGMDKSESVFTGDVDGRDTKPTIYSKKKYEAWVHCWELSSYILYPWSFEHCNDIVMLHTAREIVSLTKRMTTLYTDHDKFNRKCQNWILSGFIFSSRIFHFHAMLFRSHGFRFFVFIQPHSRVATNIERNFFVQSVGAYSGFFHFNAVVPYSGADSLYLGLK